jgi:hypothetical protein
VRKALSNNVATVIEIPVETRFPQERHKGLRLLGHTIETPRR